MLKISNLSKYYGDVVGIEDLSLEIKEGEIFGFIGPNGSGKSTTIRAVMNLIHKNQGEITIDGVSNESSEVKSLVGYLPSEINLYDDLTVLGMLKYNNTFYKEDYLDKGLELCDYFELDTKRMIEDLSLGNLKKLGIVLTLMHDPKLIVLDEPTSGLDPLMQNKFFSLLKEEQKRGKTIFFSSHVLSEIKKVCDRVGILKDGKLVKLATIKELDIEYVKVLIEAKDINKILKELKQESNEFVYTGDINKLMGVLSKYKLDKLYISEPSVEEIFMKYYGDNL